MKKPSFHYFRFNVLCFGFHLLLLTFLLSSCGTGLKVTSDYDKAVNFREYKTFSITLPIEQQKKSVSELNQNRITNAVVAEMVKKGFQQNDNNPDLMINLAVVLENKKQVTANTDYYGYGGFYRPYGWGGGLGVNGYTTYNVQRYVNGSLIIEIVDSKTKNLIWEGIGNKDLDGPLNDPDVVIPAAITKIMAGFPPGMTK